MNDVVRYADEVPNGLSSLLGELLRSRLLAHPRRMRLLAGSRVGIRAIDIGLSSTLYLEPGMVKIRNGISKSSQVRVRADSATLVSFSQGRAVPGLGVIPGLLGAIRTGTLRVEGLPRGAIALWRLQRLIAR